MDRTRAAADLEPGDRIVSPLGGSTLTVRAVDEVGAWARLVEVDRADGFDDEQAALFVPADQRFTLA